MGAIQQRNHRTVFTGQDVGVSHFLVPAPHSHSPHVPLPAGNHGQIRVDFQFGHACLNNSFDFGKSDVQDSRGLLNLFNFIGGLNHAQFANAVGYIQPAAAGEGLLKPEVKIGRQDVHFKTGPGQLIELEIHEHAGDLTFAFYRYDLI